MSYEAIIFDLDGTAMPSESNALPNQAVISAVRNSKDKIHLCAATGRSWLKAESVIKALKLTDPCITSGGALIIDPVTEQILWERRIDIKDGLGIQQATQSYKYPVACTDGLITNYADSISQAKISAALNTIYILGVPKDIAEEITENLAHIKTIVVSMAYSWSLDGGIDLHITNREATKEHAVIELCDIIKVDRRNVAGVGDGFNDIHLFNAVGYKIAMGNAVPELKEAADLIIGPQEKDGLASFIESTVNT